MLLEVNTTINLAPCYYLLHQHPWEIPLRFGLNMNDMETLENAELAEDMSTDDISFGFDDFDSDGDQVKTRGITPSVVHQELTCLRWMKSDLWSCFVTSCMENLYRFSYTAYTRYIGLENSIGCRVGTGLNVLIRIAIPSGFEHCNVVLSSWMNFFFLCYQDSIQDISLAPDQLDEDRSRDVSIVSKVTIYK